VQCGRTSAVGKGIADAKKVMLGNDIKKTWDERGVLILYVLLYNHYYALPLLPERLAYKGRMSIL
jgi:hypothetical protein